MGHPRGTHSRYVIGCCLIPLGICGLKNNSRQITYGIGCVWGMPSLSPLSSLGRNLFWQMPGFQRFFVACGDWVVTIKTWPNRKPRVKVSGTYGRDDINNFVDNWAAVFYFRRSNIDWKNYNQRSSSLFYCSSWNQNVLWTWNRVSLNGRTFLKSTKLKKECETT